MSAVDTRPIGWAVALLVMLSCITARTTDAATPATLIDADLNARPVRITSFSDGVLSYFDEQRTLRSDSVDAFVQLRLIDEAQEPADAFSPGVWFTDGQRFAGQWLGPTDDGQGLRWRHESVGDLTVPLDEVSCVIWQGEAPVDHNTVGTDVLTLLNNDELVGFVSGLTENGVTLIPDAGDDPVTIPYARIAAMTLANPARPASGNTHLLTLVDGTRIRVEELRLTGDEAAWLMNPPGDSPREARSPIGDVVRVDFGAGGLRLIDLTALAMSTPVEPRVFGMAVPVRVTGRSIRVHAPAELAFELPVGATRFAAVAELDTEGAPKNLSDWSDFQVVVSCDGEEVGRVHVTGSQPGVNVNTAVFGQTLTIRLEPGVNGPILDRLVLRDAVVLVKVPAGETDGSAGR